jgi:UDP-N-acetylglucosamine:LPS N-acetylglucosamine transferase
VEGAAPEVLAAADVVVGRPGTGGLAGLLDEL